MNNPKDMNSRLIIYPTDFSDCANNAKGYAIAMAKALQCEIRIVHTIEVGALVATEQNPEIDTSFINLFCEQADHKLTKLKKEIETFDLKCEYDILHGQTSFLKKYMEQLEPLMIVMGTLGKHDFENKLFGSFAAQTIRNPKSIVLAIPQKAKFNNLSEIVFATNFHIKDKTCLEFIKKIRKYYDTNLRVIHVSDNFPDLKKEKEKFSQLKEEITKIISSQNISFELLYGDDVEDKLLELLESSKPDMLALITRKRNFIERIFDKSLSKKMINHTNVPVLVF
ncbi:hypothetical protein GCM10023311_25680 [Flaviramulus aquimarinus]|uniref:UspA domain-containing protein n=1 Tax=Flaviramulus aquimarinus TaxID=1170456 RepID=A0ABP9FEG8_9FLAO